jgi:SAM-dependent methyltransferase
MACDRDERLLFDSRARDYDVARPGYPLALIRALLERARLPEGGRVLEIGCGTGQLTKLLAHENLTVTAVELGRNLSRVAAERLRAYPRITVVHADFEQWEPEPCTYDLVASAQAFHWIRPEVGYPKARRALGDCGLLALIWNLHPGGDSSLHRALDEVYRTLAPQMGQGTGRESLVQRVRRTTDEMNASGLFEEPDVLRFPWAISYSTKAYLRLLRTFSDHLALPASVLNGLLEGVRRTIDDHGGQIDRPIVSTLFLASPRS